MDMNNVMGFLTERFCFPIVREIIDYMPMSSKAFKSEVLNLLRSHYDLRVCRRCGEFMNTKSIKNRTKKFYCLCHYRKHYFEPSPKLNVYLHCKINITHQNHSISRQLALQHRIEEANINYINYHNVEDFYFVVDQQIKTVYNFRRALRFFSKNIILFTNKIDEKEDDKDWISRKIIFMVLVEIMMDEVKNLRTYPIFSSTSFDSSIIPLLPPDIFPKLFNPWNPPDVFPLGHHKNKITLYETLANNETNCSYHKKLQLPFTMPVQYFYPYLTNIRNLPSNSLDQFLYFFQHQWKNKTILTYDPLHLLPPLGKKRKRI